MKVVIVLSCLFSLWLFVNQQSIFLPAEPAPHGFSRPTRDLPPEAWRNLTFCRTARFGGPQVDRQSLHTNWTVERLEAEPGLLLHVESCHREGSHTLQRLEQQPALPVCTSFRHPLEEVVHPDLARLNRLLALLQSQKSLAAAPLEHVLARLDPARHQALIAYSLAPDNRDWWLDFQALARRGGPAFQAQLERVRNSPDPSVRQLAVPLAYLANPNDRRRWRAALAYPVLSQNDIWLRNLMLREGPTSWRGQVLERCVRSSHLWQPRPDPPASLDYVLWEWAARAQDPELANLAAPFLRRTRTWDAVHNLKARRLVESAWLSPDNRRLLAERLLANDRQLPSALRRRWITQWSIQLSNLCLSAQEEKQYLPIFQKFAAQDRYSKDSIRALWNQGLLRGSTIMQRLLNLQSANSDSLGWKLHEEMPDEVFAFLLETCDDPDLWSQLWQHESRELTPELERALLRRLQRGKFSDSLTWKLLLRISPRSHQPELLSMRQQGGAAGGFASALLGKVDLDRSDPTFLAYHLLTHQCLAHTNLDLARVYALQEGAPARLFQAASLYLQASPSPQARDLERRRGGRVLYVRGSSGAGEWLAGVSSRARQSGTVVYGWNFGEAESWVERDMLTVQRANERHQRRLDPAERRWLSQLESPPENETGRSSAFDGGLLAVVGPEGGWCHNFSHDSHAALAQQQNWRRRLQAISANPGGVTEWIPHPGVRSATCLLYRPGLDFDQLERQNGQLILHHSDGSGWVNLELKPVERRERSSPTDQQGNWESGNYQMTLTDPRTEKTILEFPIPDLSVRSTQILTEKPYVYYTAAGRVWKVRPQDWSGLDLL